MQRGEWELAVTLLREVVAAVPGNARLHNTLGIALSSAGHADKAATQFNRALELEPAYPSALKNLALHEMSRKRPEAAKPYFERLLAAPGEDSFAHLGLAEIAYSKGEFAKAIPHFEESHGLLVRDPGLLLNFARALLQTGRPSKAVLALEKVPAEARRTCISKRACCWRVSNDSLRRRGNSNWRREQTPIPTKSASTSSLRSSVAGSTRKPSPPARRCWRADRALQSSRTCYRRRTRAPGTRSGPTTRCAPQPSLHRAMSQTTSTSSRCALITRISISASRSPTSPSSGCPARIASTCNAGSRSP